MGEQYSFSYPFLLYYSTAATLLGSLQFGFQIAILNTCLESVRHSLRFPKAHDAVVVSCVLLGALFGALGAGSLADKLGPKRATIVNTLPLALGSITAAFSSTELVFILGRLLAGLGTGAASLLVPRVLTEIAPVQIRGLISTFNQVLINGGIVIAFASGWPYDSDAGARVHVFGSTVPWWRCMVALGVIPAGVQAVGMLFCPETPVWLHWQGRHSEARDACTALQGTTTFREAAEVSDPLEPSGPLETGHEVDEDVDQDDETTSARTTGFLGLLKPKYRHILLLAAGLPILQQLSGINTVILYGSDVLRSAGIRSPILANLILGTVNLVATLIAAALMDRLGRKRLLVWSFAGMGVCLGTMSGILLLAPAGKNNGIWFTMTAGAASTASFWMIVLYIICFALGCGPVPWVYLPEILPDIIKGSAQALGTGLSWLGNVFVGTTFPAMVETLGLGASYGFYSIACLAATIYCSRFMVETKRRQLAAVHAELLGLE